MDDELHTKPVHVLNRAAVVVVLQQLFRLGSTMMHLSAHTYFAMVQSSHSSSSKSPLFRRKIQKENIYYDWVMRSNAVVVSTRVCVFCALTSKLERRKKEHRNRLLKIQRMELLPLMTTVPVDFFFQRRTAVRHEELKMLIKILKNFIKRSRTN